MLFSLRSPAADGVKKQPYDADLIRTDWLVDIFRQQGAYENPE